MAIGKPDEKLPTPGAARLYASDSNWKKVITDQMERANLVIFHVGKFGRFKKRQLNLKPGQYTVVGVRSGYRDVRKIVSLLPGQDAPMIDVRCEEKI